MDRAFLDGHLHIDFLTEPFDSVPRMLLRSAAVFWRNLSFVAAVTLAVYLPGKLALQFICYVLDIPAEGILSYVLLEVSDLVLGALVAPALIYGLVTRIRGDDPAPLGECFLWGRRQWGKTLWNRLQVEITVMLSSLLLFVPGIMAMVRLTFTDAIVAIEGDRETQVLTRSSVLSQGRRWRIFLVLLPMMALDLAGTVLSFSALQAAQSRALFAVADSLLAVIGQWTTVAVLLMYFGLAGPERPPAASAKAIRPARSSRTRRLRRAA
jgi:hypothetical protein